VVPPRGDRPSTQPGRADRLAAVLARDGGTCTWCGRGFDALVPPTTDHLVPKVKGGPSWSENEVAACRRCNGQRGHRGAVDWLEECERRGWSADADRVRRVLESLGAAIAERGGQRRARPQLAAQLRRLRRRDD
jgi:5-methylcytosine-specific restriction endonuclease McrA